LPDTLLGTMSTQPIPKRVLVVDDDAMSRELLAVLLEGEGCVPESADSGESALDQIRRGESAPDLVLADVQLPGISGASLARKLRRACGPATILFAMSGSQPPAQSILLFDGFLLKPFKMDQVAAAIHARENQTKIPQPAKREKATLPKSKLVSSAASAAKSASKDPMGTQTQVHKPQSSEATNPDTSTEGFPVLNETIYRQLAVSVPSRQLQEMYTMCVNDARERIAGMRKLAADHDAARFVREAHAIKGGCGMLGATELHRMAAKLETNGPDAAAPGRTQNVNSLDELSAACDRLERMLGSRV
jgi:CheY-like chemotaxis protein/HPt (histidine-containing phosphotransfer) domain-containing protein